MGGTGDAAALGGTPARWGAACEAARAVPPGGPAARDFFETWFQPYAVSDGTTGSAAGLFTGYYEPEVAGSRIPGSMFATPLLGRPSDIVSVDLGRFAPDLAGRHAVGRVAGSELVPYFDRAAIVEGGALGRRRLELVWLADPIDAFVLQIQGSGRVRLPDGRVVRVTYDGQNGHPYVPIGRVLRDRGEIPADQITMQSIRAWLESHPAQSASVMDENPSYVFFRETRDLGEESGPPGALGVALTPGRSAAIDRHFLPLGAPVFIATRDPVGGMPIERLFIGQDLGGAIKGPVRADLFWGWGPDAEARAGRMHESGMAYLLLPRAGAQTVQH